MNPDSFPSNRFENPIPGSPEALELDKKLEAMRTEGANDLEEQLKKLTPEELTAFEEAVKERDATDRRAIQ